MMAYNHRKAEIEWLNWKEKEEKQMRELGVDEDTFFFQAEDGIRDGYR